MNTWHHIHDHSGMKPMTGWVYLYALCHPITLAIYYVGQSVDPATRYNSHLYDPDDTAKCKWIARLRTSGKKPRLAILAVVPALVADEMERALIEFLGRSYPLTNSRQQ